ncbi:hypothetical protein [Burkholderia ubonensis]|uniref:hypothetical protein n=1 Tax=Burkholderia ubonensis TaxID=101571 RepID=UPI0012BA98A5|nr:hypothetical protein [Burkholderia ubonensis]
MADASRDARLTSRTAASTGSPARRSVASFPRAGGQFPDPPRHGRDRQIPGCRLSFPSAFVARLSFRFTPVGFRADPYAGQPGSIAHCGKFRLSPL